MLFIAAEAREFSGLLKFCRSVNKLDWPVDWVRSAELKGRKVVLAANGAGPRLAAAVLDAARSGMSNGSMEAVVSTGFCGGLDPELKIGDVFVANCIQVGSERAAVRVPQTERKYASGILVSMDRVAQTAEEKQDLRSSGASVVEMEAAGMLPRVREWGMPFYCIRSVTDLANESFRLDFNAVRDSGGRFSTPRILAAAVQRPFTVGPELIELRNRCVIAARSLGEFIADCRF
jgi:adenosylhomocysteine nucleosidase